MELVQDFPGAYGYQWYAENGLIAVNQGSYFANFVKESRSDFNETHVSVNFYNPFGEQTTIVRTFLVQNN